MKSNLLRIVNTYEYEYGLKPDGAWTQFSSLEEAILTIRLYFKDWVTSALLSINLSLCFAMLLLNQKKISTKRRIFQDFYDISRKTPDRALFSLQKLKMEGFLKIVILFNKTGFCSNQQPMLRRTVMQ